MKIALVRGPSLTRWELQSFESLADKFEVCAFVTPGSGIEAATRTNLKVQTLFWPDQWARRLHPRGTWLFNGLASRLLGVTFHMRGLESALQGFDIIHSLETHNTFSYQAARAKRRYGGKLVLTVWETIVGRGESHPLRAARKRFVMKQTDLFLAVTERTRQMLLAEGADDTRIQVLPMGVDLARFSPRPPDPLLVSEWRKSEGEFVVVCIARLVEEKGLAFLLQAMAALRSRSQRVSLRLVLVGTGPMEKKLRDQVAAAGLENRVVFAGQKPYDAVPAVLASAQALVLPSVSTAFWEEQFGYVLVEAMAMGLPVITTRSGAIPEVVGDAAVLVPERDAAALASALERVAEDAALRASLQQKGRARAAERYDGRKTAQELERLYSRAMKG